MGCGNQPLPEQTVTIEKPLKQTPNAKPTSTPASNEPLSTPCPLQKLFSVPFCTKTTLKMNGGYLTTPKKNEQIQQTQILVSAPSSNKIHFRVLAEGKVGMIAIRPGAEFPLSFITEVIQSSQIGVGMSEMTVESPGPNGIVVYIISEGKPASVEIDGLGKMILDIQHGDLSYIPPKLVKNERKAKTDQKITTKRFINYYSCQMHGGFEIQEQAGEEVDDNQVMIQTGTGNLVRISAACSGKVGLIAMRKSNNFPLESSTDILASSGLLENQVSLDVTSPGAMIVYIVSNGQLVDLHIDGLQKTLLAVSHGEDHIPTRRESSISHSSRSSVYKKSEFRAPVKQTLFTVAHHTQLKGGFEIDNEPGIDIIDGQILVYAPTGNKVKIGAKGIGKVGIAVMHRDTFPLVKTTEIIGWSGVQMGEASITVNSVGPRGMVVYFIGNGKIDTSIDGLGSMLLEVAEVI
ncbi:Conserved_hypothetical protein [Hexamita inflata]|uniref:Uncharacterized protein n=1 Tax=Hexamita inflata TaxID=28002 RepID=A0AA86URV8_9EUKA|nr:Conserved hypothetical protein [Hexamita inflata]